MIGATSKAKIVVGLGELLWDLLPEGPRLGGAPANFAVMAGRLGDRAVVASRLGADDLGAEARAVLAKMPVDLSRVQTDTEFPTGAVRVSLKGGEARYTFDEPVAWDRLEFTPAWADLAGSADAVCFGTLAQREAAAKRTIRQFVDATRRDCVRVFDVNLRQPYWSDEVLRESLGRATILKLNADELPLVLQGSGSDTRGPAGYREEELLREVQSLLSRYPVALVCVTLGGEGSLLVTPRSHHRHPGIRAHVKDTVGAGDAFTAALTHYYLQGAPLAALNEAGNLWGAWMASQSGAMPPLEAATTAQMAEKIENAGDE
jgi:fructokinase